MTEESRPRLDYADKLILAPMVRIGTLPMRLLALEYGADIVYTEELIDWKLLRSVRRENHIDRSLLTMSLENQNFRMNDHIIVLVYVGNHINHLKKFQPNPQWSSAVLGTVDYVDRTDGTIVFRTCEKERDRVVLQLGTCDAERAAKVARLVERDVAGIDVNMGCPKRFSILGGMGAALLSQPSKACEILRGLVQAVPQLPVTCKIRVLADLDETLKLVDELAATGIEAIAVHGRTKDERPQHPNRNQTLCSVARHLAIPVIANGGSKEVEKRADIFRFKSETGCSSVMLARAAEWNCSIFRKEGLLPMDEVIRAYLKLAVDYDNSPSNTKYCVQNILRDLQETPLGRRFLDAQTLQQICDVWEMGDYCREKYEAYRAQGLQGRFEVMPGELDGGGAAKRKLEQDADDVLLMRCAFLRNSYPDDVSLPKSRLIKWTRDNRKKLPSYQTINEDKLFRAIAIVDGRKYGSSFWEKSKKWAEQGAALVCLCALGVIDAESLTKSGNLLPGR